VQRVGRLSSELFLEFQLVDDPLLDVDLLHLGPDQNLSVLRKLCTGVHPTSSCGHAHSFSCPHEIDFGIGIVFLSHLPHRRSPHGHCFFHYGILCTIHQLSDHGIRQFNPLRLNHLLHHFPMTELSHPVGFWRSKKVSPSQNKPATSACRSKRCVPPTL